MVEGGRIDHAAHQLDVATMAREIIEFDKAVQVAHRFAKKNRRTLVLVTADHETAGLSITESLNHDYLRNQKISPAYLYDQWKAIDFDDEFIKKSVKEHFDYKLTKHDLKRLNSVRAKGKFHTATVLGSLIAKKAGLLSVSLDMILVGNTFGHTASPVPIFGFGPKSNYFSGYMDNTLIAKKISRATRVPLKSQ